MPATATPRRPTRAAGTLQTLKVLTVSEGKRLIARGIPRMPLVQNALNKGMVIITKGTTTTYIAKEILKTDVPHGSLLIGTVYPEKGGDRLEPCEPIGELILVDGQHRKDLSLAEALKKLPAGRRRPQRRQRAGLRNKLAAGLIGVPSTTAGTTGKIVPAIVGTKAN